MADQETELEWEKSKRIEKEIKKADLAMMSEKPSKANLAFLDPKSTKVKGWTNDSDAILASAERMGNRAIVLTISGIVLSIIGYAGSAVTTVSKLGAAGALISGLPSGVGMVCLGLSVLMSTIALGSEIIARVRYGRRFGASFWTAVISLVLVGVYFVVMRLVLVG